MGFFKGGSFLRVSLIIREMFKMEFFSKRIRLTDRTSLERIVTLRVSQKVFIFHIVFKIFLPDTFSFEKMLFPNLDQDTRTRSKSVLEQTIKPFFSSNAGGSALFARRTLFD